MYHVDWDDFDLPLDKLQVQQHIHKVALLAYEHTSLYGKYTRLLSGIEKKYLVADKYTTIFDTSDKISSMKFTSQNVSSINIQFFYNSFKSGQKTITTTIFFWQKYLLLKLGSKYVVEILNRDIASEN